MKKQMHKILLTSAIATFMLGGSALPLIWFPA